MELAETSAQATHGCTGSSRNLRRSLPQLCPGKEQFPAHQREQRSLPAPWSPCVPFSLERGAQCLHALSPKSSPIASLNASPPVFRYPGDHNFNLSEYMVVLDKPIGLTLAPDPTTGQIVVQDIKDGSPAALSGMIQVGDIVKMCSAVFGEDMWQAIDIRRIRWAINNRTSKIKLVLERTRKPHVVPTWYSKGQVGRTSQERDTLQLPVSFTSSQQDDWSQDMAAPGRPLMCAFHTSVLGTSQVAQRSGAAAVARSSRLHVLREELAEARREPEMELGPPAAAASSAQAGAGGAGTAMSGAAAASTAQASGSNNSSGMARSNSSNNSGGGVGKAAGAGAGGSDTSAATARAGGGGSNGGSNSVGPLGRLIESLAGGMAVPGTAGNNSNSSGSSSSPSGGAGSGASGASAGASGSTSVAGPQQATRRGTSGPRDKKVTPVLPWLLVSSGRLDTRDLTQIASHRGLSAVLELGLTRGVTGVLSVRGSEAGGNGLGGGANSLSEVNVSALLASAAAAGVSGGAGGGGAPGAAAAPHTPATAPVVPPAALASRVRPPVGADASGPGGAPSVELRYRCLVHAAAALQRLVVRRTHGSLHHSPPEACHVLLHCGEAGMEAEVACLLASWLHWYACMPLQEALLSAEIAMGCAIEQGVVEGATEALVAAAEERSNKVVLTWRYGGLSASVAGDLVGSWATRMSLMRCKNPLGCKGSVARGNFFLELTGLRPGVYYYKYIVDGTWAVDPAAPKVLDASGNWNNVLEVHQRPPVSSSRERLALARWHARHLSWETKMGLRPL